MNDERFRSDEDNSVLLSRLRIAIYGIGIAAAFVAITVYRLIGELYDAPQSCAGARSPTARRLRRR